MSGSAQAEICNMVFFTESSELQDVAAGMTLRVFGQVSSVHFSGATRKDSDLTRTFAPQHLARVGEQSSNHAVMQ